MAVSVILKPQILADRLNGGTRALPLQGVPLENSFRRRARLRLRVSLNHRRERLQRLSLCILSADLGS